MGSCDVTAHPQTVRHGFPYQPSALAFDPVQKILAVGTQTGALRLYPFLKKKKSVRLLLFPQSACIAH